ncbi:MAG: hypothetical protein E7325_05225 [Clostridiales bacterium]|nr:hypothetical protein [Clostridiales bacterium]
MGRQALDIRQPADSRKPLDSRKFLEQGYAVCVLLLFLHHFAVLLFYPVWAAGAQKLTPVFALFAAAGILLGKLWKRKECWLLAAFWVWMLIRVVLEKRSLPVEAIIILSAAAYAFLIAFPAFGILRPAFRKSFLMTLSGIWTLITAGLAVWGVVLCWTGGRVLNFAGEFFGLTEYGRLALFSNPNITGGFFAGGVCLALLGFCLFEKRWVRVLCLLSVLPMIMATSLSGTRCAALAISTAVCIWVCLLLQKPLKGVKGRYAILAVVFVLCFGALTLAQIRFNGYFIQFRNSRVALLPAASAEEEAESQSEDPESEESESEEAESVPKKPAYIQQRGGLNFSSLDDLTSGRIGIWADGFRYFRGSVRRILLGDSVLNPGLAELRMNHYHNLYLQVLYESGIVGFLPFLAILGLFLVRAFRLIRREDLPLWQRFLPAPTLAILVMELLDCLTLFANGHPPMTLLWFFMGATVVAGGDAAAAEPEKNPEQRKLDRQKWGRWAQQAAVVVLSLLIAGTAGVVNRNQPLPVLLAAVILSFGLPCVLGGRYVSGKPLFPVSGRKFLWAGLAVICLLWLLLALNNSSVGVWRLILTEQDYGTLLGVARPIRGDEWAVWMPELFSQAAQGWPAVNTAITAGAVDPALVAIGGLPAWNLAAVFKPFYWGFLLLGAEAGFSLMTLLRFACLALMSFLAAKRYTRNHLPLSVAAAFLITLSPYVQWWYSQSICEVLIFSQAAVLAWIRAMEAKTAGRRLAWAALAAWCLGCFVLVLYPAWLIPVAWGMLAVLLWLALRYRKQLRGPAVLQALAPLIPVALLLFFIFRNSWDTLMRIQASVYPGQRVYTGGDRPLSLFTGLYSLTFPAVASTAANTSDLANFLSFAPAGLILAGIRWVRTKKADGFSVVLLILTAVFGLFAWIPLPAGLAKGTLLSLCSRPAMILSLCNLLLLLRTLALWDGEKCSCKSAVLWALICALLSVGLSFAMLHPPVFLAAGLLVLGFGVFWLLFSGRAPRLMVVTLCLLSVLAGAFVNPVQKGLASVKELSPVRAVESADLPADTVLAVEADWPAPDALLFSGKRVLNSTFPYADPEKWRLVDPEGRWEQVWNRLCHVSLTVAEENSGGEKFALVDFDHISVSLTPAELRTLGVQVLVTQKDHPELPPVGENGSWKVYGLSE